MFKKLIIGALFSLPLFTLCACGDDEEKIVDASQAEVKNYIFDLSSQGELFSNGSTFEINASIATQKNNESIVTTKSSAIASICDTGVYFDGTYTDDKNKVYSANVNVIDGEEKADAYVIYKDGTTTSKYYQLLDDDFDIISLLDLIPSDGEYDMYIGLIKSFMSIESTQLTEPTQTDEKIDFDEVMKSLNQYGISFVFSGKKTEKSNQLKSFSLAVDGGLLFPISINISGDVNGDGSASSLNLNVSYTSTEAKEVGGSLFDTYQYAISANISISYESKYTPKVPTDKANYIEYNNLK